ncbi:MT-A70-domain-containing protein [Colletotrichum caudatum]|nr:MT-A70-domain-containing protein [Colletotrichum caudatum]
MAPRPPSQPSPACSSPRSILFQNEDRSVVLVDIPASLEEGQFLPDSGAGTTGPQRRLLSVEPIATPFCVPEPRDPATNNQTPAGQLADLMIEAAARSALDTLAKGHSAPFCLPRVIGGGGGSGATSASECGKMSLHDHPARQDDVGDTAAATAHFIPEKSAYLSGSIQETREAFLSTAPRFDLIVLDPPWPNKSARRKKRKTGGYSTAYGLEETRALLDHIPVAGHLAEGGLVAIWVTNKATLVDLLTSPRGGVLAGWGLEVAAEWVWVKLTAGGEPVSDPGSVWRKPWERLIVARRRGDGGRKVPQRVVAAVPDVHSRKPNLRRLFEDQLPRGYLGLEVFARNLTAGWWGWGDEVLRFQEPRHWIVCPGQPEQRSEPEKSEFGDADTN